MTGSSHASTTEADGVITVTFERPEKLNAISPEMTERMRLAVLELRDRDELRIMVIRAVGRYFSAGIDLHSSVGSGGDIDPARVAAGAAYRNHLREHTRLYDDFESVEKPVVLAAQGPCLGAGLELALSCDFRLAATGARFALPEIGLGVLPGSGGVSRLTRVVGPHWARWIAMANRAVDAPTAFTIGLVHEVLDDDEAAFHQHVHDFAVELAELPQEALGLAKIAIDACASTDRATARDVERIANTTLNFSPEFRTRLDAFRAR